MKVLHIGKYFPPRYGGIETFMSELMEEQHSAGHQVAALVHADVLRSPTMEYNWKGCEIFEVKTYGQVVFAPIAPMYPFRLYRALKKIKPDILHVHLPNLSAFWLLIFKFLTLTKSRIIIHWHSDVLGATPSQAVKALYPVYRMFENALLRVAEKVIVTSPPYLASSVPLCSHKDKSCVIPLGIKTSVQSLALKREFKSVLNMIMVGRLTYYKNHSLVIRAIDRLRMQNTDVKLNIIGDGELKSSLLNLVDQLQLQSHIKFWNHVSNEKKHELLEDADLLLLPSMERTEAFGVVLLEAFGHGVPAIVSDVDGSGMSYVVHDMENGMVVKNNDEEDLANKIRFAAQNRALLQEMGKQAYSRLKNEFDIGNVARQINLLYGEK